MKDRDIVLTLFFVAIFLATPWTVVSDTVDRVVARVGPEPITQGEVQSVQSDNPSLTFSTALNALIERRLVVSWARKNRLDVSQGELEKVEQSIMVNNNLSEANFEELLASRGQDRHSFREDLAEQVLVNKALGTIIGQGSKVTEEEIRKRYENDYSPTGTLTIRHILLKPDPASGETEDAIRERAVRILDEIRAGAPFEAMAKQHSMDEASAATGGELGTFRAGELLPELESLALTLEPGETGGPVRTSLGFHILNLESKGVWEPPPLSSVEEEIRASLAEEKRVEVQRRWLEELRQSTFIEIFSDGE